MRREIRTSEESAPPDWQLEPGEEAGVKDAIEPLIWRIGSLMVSSYKIGLWLRGAFDQLYACTY